eukprot:jgi/Botrbrau1/7157/Bobra.0143s0029.1
MSDVWLQSRSAHPGPYRRSPTLEGCVEALEELLGRGAAIEAQDEEDWVPLHYAAQAGHPSTVKCLLQRGASAAPITLDGDTPLHFAATHGHGDVVELLVDAGADVDVQNGNGQTPLHEATVHGQFDVVQQLLTMGARVDMRTNEGDTALHKAARWNQIKIAALLLDYAADTQATDLMGRRPVDRTMDERMASLTRKTVTQTKEAVRNKKTWQSPKYGEELDSTKCTMSGTWDASTARADYEQRWALFADGRSTENPISFAQVPWPAGNDDSIRDVVFVGLTDDNHRKLRTRTELLRWHPDKFEAAFGQRLVPLEKDKIMARVKGISQMLLAM